MYGVSLGTIQYYLKYRAQRGHAGGLVKHWHPDEDERLKLGMDRGENFEQIGQYIGRTQRAVRARFERLGLRKSA